MLFLWKRQVMIQAGVDKPKLRGSWRYFSGGRGLKASD